MNSTAKRWLSTCTLGESNHIGLDVETSKPEKD